MNKEYKTSFIKELRKEGKFKGYKHRRHRKKSKKRLMAGGASEKFFETMWRLSEQDFEAFQNAVKQKKYHKAGGDVFYLVSGRKSKKS